MKDADAGAFRVSRREKWEKGGTEPFGFRAAFRSADLIQESPFANDSSASVCALSAV